MPWLFESTLEKLKNKLYKDKYNTLKNISIMWKSIQNIVTVRRLKKGQFKMRYFKSIGGYNEIDGCVKNQWLNSFMTGASVMKKLIWTSEEAS